MRQVTYFAVAALIVAACGGAATPTTQAATPTTAAKAETTTAAPEPETTQPAPTTTQPEEVSGPQFVISSLSLGENGMVVITNIGTEAGSLSGYYLCQRPNYFAIPAVDLEPGQSAAISTGGNVFLPPPGAIAVEQIATIGPLSPTSGEVGLYSSSNFNSAPDIVSYVEWGSSGHGRSGVAIQAGIWPANSFVETSEDTILLTANTLPATDPSLWDVFSG